MAGLLFKMIGKVTAKDSYTFEGKTSHTVTVAWFGGSHTFRFDDESELERYPAANTPVVIEGSWAINPKGYCRLHAISSRVATNQEIIASIDIPEPPAENEDEGKPRPAPKSGAAPGTSSAPTK